MIYYRIRIFVYVNKKDKKNIYNGNEIGELKVYDVVVYRMKEMKILIVEMKYMLD